MAKDEAKSALKHPTEVLEQECGPNFVSVCARHPYPQSSVRTEPNQHSGLSPTQTSTDTRAPRNSVGAKKCSLCELLLLVHSFQKAEQPAGSSHLAISPFSACLAISLLQS